MRFKKRVQKLIDAGKWEHALHNPSGYTLSQGERRQLKRYAQIFAKLFVNF